MYEVLLFTVSGIFLYILADRVLLKIESMRGRPFENRQLIYFFIILILALGLFQILQRLGPGIVNA